MIQIRGLSVYILNLGNYFRILQRFHAVAVEIMMYIFYRLDALAVIHEL